MIISRENDKIVMQRERRSGTMGSEAPGLCSAVRPGLPPAGPHGGRNGYKIPLAGGCGRPALRGKRRNTG